MGSWNKSSLTFGQSESEPPVFFFCLSFVCLEKKRHKTEVLIGALPCCPMERPPHPMGVSHGCLTGPGPGLAGCLYLGGTDPSEEAREATISYGPSPVASTSISVLSSRFLFSSFSGLPKCRTAGTGRLGREFSGFGSDGNGYAAQVTLFLAGTSSQRCQSVRTSRVCRTSNNSHHFWSIYSEPG